MPDISMCKNNTCPLNSQCYRYLAKPDSDWQSYADFQPTILSETEAECDYFWPVKDTQNDTEIDKPFV